MNKTVLETMPMLKAIIKAQGTLQGNMSDRVCVENAESDSPRLFLTTQGSNEDQAIKDCTKIQDRLLQEGPKDLRSTVFFIFGLQTKDGKLTLEGLQKASKSSLDILRDFSEALNQPYSLELHAEPQPFKSQELTGFEQGPPVKGHDTSKPVIVLDTMPMVKEIWHIKINELKEEDPEKVVCLEEFNSLCPKFIFKTREELQGNEAQNSFNEISKRLLEGQAPSQMYGLQDYLESVCKTNTDQGPICTVKNLLWFCERIHERATTSGALHTHLARLHQSSIVQQQPAKSNDGRLYMYLILMLILVVFYILSQLVTSNTKIEECNL